MDDKRTYTAKEAIEMLRQSQAKTEREWHAYNIAEQKQNGTWVEPEAIHGWFGLSYASYLVLPRSVLQSLPDDLQHQLVEALDEIEDYLHPARVPVSGTYNVQLRDEKGRFIKDPLADYQRGRRRVTKEDLLAMQERAD